MKTTILILLTLLMLVSCTSEKTDNTEAPVSNETTVSITDAQYKTAGIRTGKIEKRSISTTLKLNGKIDVPPQNMVSVSIPLGGFLKSSKLLPGMRIKKGDVLAVMEDQQYIQLQQDYLTAKSKLIYFEKEYTRQKELNQSKASSDKFFQQTEMDFKTQKIAVSALAEKLRLIHINPEQLSEDNLSRNVNVYSSIDGFVSKVNVNIGKYVNASDVLFELINPEDIHLNLKVFERDLAQLSIGQKLSAYNNTQPEKKYACEIILISQDLATDRSAEVHCHFDNYDKALLPGMYMNADVSVNVADQWAIHSDAIVSFEGKDFIVVEEKPMHFTLVEIVKGSSENGYTGIRPVQELDLEKQSIVINGAYSLLMQSKTKAE